MTVEQGISLYPGNLANTNDLYLTASQLHSEQFGSMGPHPNPLYGAKSTITQ